MDVLGYTVVGDGPVATDYAGLFLFAVYTVTSLKCSLVIASRISKTLVIENRRL